MLLSIVYNLNGRGKATGLRTPFLFGHVAEEAEYSLLILQSDFFLSGLCTLRTRSPYAKRTQRKQMQEKPDTFWNLLKATFGEWLLCRL